MSPSSHCGRTLFCTAKNVTAVNSSASHARIASVTVSVSVSTSPERNNCAVSNTAVETTKGGGRCLHSSKRQTSDSQSEVQNHRYIANLQANMRKRRPSRHLSDAPSGSDKGLASAPATPLHASGVRNSRIVPLGAQRYPSLAKLSTPRTRDAFTAAVDARVVYRSRQLRCNTNRQPRMCRHVMRVSLRRFRM